MPTRRSRCGPAPGCRVPAREREREARRRRGRPLSLDGGFLGGPRSGEGPPGPTQAPGRWRRGGVGGWGEASPGGLRGRDPGGAGAQRRRPGSPPPPSPKSTCFFRFVLFLARYWEDFHSCTVTALTDCQEGAKDMWDKLRKESKNLNIQGSLFELCGSGNGAAGSLLPALPVLLVSLSAALATWLSF